MTDNASPTDRLALLAPVSMKALTLWQPWASLIAIGAKTIETRSWSTNYRGPLAIHAAATMPSYNNRYVKDVSVRHLNEHSGGEWRLSVYRAPKTPTTLRSDYRDGDWPCPLGAVVATCTLVDVVPMVSWAPLDGPAVTAVHAVRAHFDEPIVLLRDAANAKGTPLPPTDEPTADDLTDQIPYGDFAPGRYAWILADVVPVDPPIPARGRQQLWTWRPPEAAHIKEDQAPA